MLLPLLPSVPLAMTGLVLPAARHGVAGGRGEVDLQILPVIAGGNHSRIAGRGAGYGVRAGGDRAGIAVRNRAVALQDTSRGHIGVGGGDVAGLGGGDADAGGGIGGGVERVLVAIGGGAGNGKGHSGERRRCAAGGVVLAGGLIGCRPAIGRGVAEQERPAIGGQGAAVADRGGDGGAAGVAAAAGDGGGGNREQSLALRAAGGEALGLRGVHLASEDGSQRIQRLQRRIAGLDVADGGTPGGRRSG